MFSYCGQTFRHLLSGSRRQCVRARLLCFWLTYTYCLGSVRASGIASWYGARSALIRDSIFIEGGFLSWGNWSNNSVGYGSSTTLDPDFFNGMLYRFDLSLALNPSDLGRSLTEVNIPRYSTDIGHCWGSMFVDADGFVLFGYVLLKCRVLMFN